MNHIITNPARLGAAITAAARKVAMRLAESQSCTIVGPSRWTIPLSDWRGKLTYDVINILSGRMVSPITVDIAPAMSGLKELIFRPNCGGSISETLHITPAWNAAEKTRVESARSNQGLLVSAAVHLNAVRKAGGKVRDCLNAGEIIILEQHGFDLGE